jgi:hypothetical protein
MNIFHHVHEKYQEIQYQQNFHLHHHHRLVVDVLDLDRDDHHNWQLFVLYHLQHLVQHHLDLKFPIVFVDDVRQPMIQDSMVVFKRKKIAEKRKKHMLKWKVYDASLNDGFEKINFIIFFSLLSQPLDVVKY